MIASLLFRASFKRFLAACRTPLDAQARCLRRDLRRAARTRVGRSYDFAGLARLRDAAGMIAAYQERVPIRSYAAMRADLDAVYADDWRLLCPSRPIYFAMTAGSTGRFKYIPVTPELRRDLGRGSLTYYGAIEAACPALRGLKGQFLVGSAEGGLSPGGIPQGFASGFNYKNLPRFLRAKFVLPYWIFTLADAEDRAYAAGRILADHADLGALCAVSPVNLINLKTALEQNVDRLCADLRAGSLSLRSRSAVPGRYRGRPNQRRAQALEDAWRRDGTLPLEQLFPSLQLLVCWQGGTMSYYLDEMARHFGGPELFEFPVSASEGLFAIPFQKNVAGGIAAVTSHFLEFIPEDAAAAPAALHADQLRTGAQYRLVVTTSGGLYRYDMEDIVRVTGFYECTPIITFVSRANRQVSVANERLSETDVTHAMAAATRRLGLRVPEFLFVPCSDRRYRVLVDGHVVNANLSGFIADLERQLRAAATGYDFEREDALLKPLELVVTHPGELRAYLGAGSGPGALPNAQIKPTHLTCEFDAHRRFAVMATYAA